MNVLRAQRRRAQRPKERGGRKVTPVHAPPLSRRDADSQGSLHHGACAAGCGVWLLYPGRDNSGLHSALLLRAAARQRCPQHAAWQGHPASRDWSAWAQGCNRLRLEGHARNTLDGRTPPHFSPVVSHPLTPMQTVPTLLLEDIEAAVSSGDCPSVFDLTKIQFDILAAVLSGSAEDNENCLADAYAQPGFCELMKDVCCPSCTFGPDARPTTSHQHAQPSIPLHPRTPRRSNATHCCTCIDSPLPASPSNKFATFH